MGFSHNCWLYGCCLLLTLKGSYGLSNVTVVVDPPAVISGGDVTLECLYDLEGDSLYTVKWYRGTREFYRFSPRDTPLGKAFHQGEMFKVDLNSSNATQVTLRGVEYRLGGNISCEVTMDRGFKTVIGYGYLEVVILPSGNPSIYLEAPKYKTGDKLRGNCTFHPSKPQARLRAYINRRPLAITTDEEQNSIELLLDPLKPGDFFDERAGSFEISCVANIGRHLSRNTTLWVGPQKNNADPVPARVRSSNGSGRLTSSCIIFLLLLRHAT